MSQKLKENVRNSILDAAIYDLYENGYSKSSMRKIASQANMTVGNLYRYFKNKDELVNTIIQPVLNRINEILQKNTNQSLDLNDEHFDLKPIKIDNIPIFLDELSTELVHIYDQTPKTLVILMMHTKINENILKWLTLLIMEIMISKKCVQNENRKCYELLARSYAVSVFAGVHECLKQKEIEKEDLILVVRTYFQSCFLIFENHIKQMEG